MSMEKRQGIQSLEIGISILETVVREGRPLRLGEIAERCALSASKTRMYLISLLRTGMVDQSDVSGAYQTGPAIVRLGLLALQGNLLFQAAHALASMVAAETADPVFLSSWDSNRSVIIFASKASDSLPIYFRVGAPTSLLDTATGRTFLAFKSKEDLAHALNANGIGTPNAHKLGTQQRTQLNAKGNSHDGCDLSSTLDFTAAGRQD